MGLILHIIGFVTAIWVFRDARSRGTGLGMSLLWGAGVTAFILIFLPLYLVVGRRRIMTPAEPAELQEVTIEGEAEFLGELISCPMCAKNVRDDYKHCPYCGFTLKLECEGCGRTLERGWKACPDCGQAVPEK